MCLAVVALWFFAGSFLLGIVLQTAGALNDILYGLPLVVFITESLSSFSAAMGRLSTFLKRMKAVDEGRPLDSVPHESGKHNVRD